MWVAIVKLIIIIKLIIIKRNIFLIPTRLDSKYHKALYIFYISGLKETLSSLAVKRGKEQTTFNFMTQGWEYQKK